MAPTITRNNERLPSSSLSEENLATSFDNMLLTENPQKEFLSYLERLKSIYLRTEAYMNDFDKELDQAIDKGQAIDFETSKAYKKLLVMRSLSVKIHDKITYFYLKLNELANDTAQDASQREIAKDVLKNFKIKLDSTEPLERTSFEDLKNHIYAGLVSQRGLSTAPLDHAVIPLTSFITHTEKVDLVRKFKNQFRNLGKELNEKQDELTQKIEEESAKLLLLNSSGRDPQSTLTYYPSTGANGNIMGLNFPKGVWALTYDDGPHAKYTPEIVKNLEALGIKATFFWLAENVIRLQSTIDLVKSNGHAMGNHSWTHPQLPKLTDQQLQKEINQSTEVDTKAYGQKVEFFRCPYGAGTNVPRIRQRIADLGMIHVFWNVDTLDWQDKDPDSIVLRAEKQIKTNSHGVILFHDIHPQSVIASKKLVEWSKTLKGTESEMRWVTLPEIVKETNEK